MTQPLQPNGPTTATQPPRPLPGDPTTVTPNRATATHPDRSSKRVSHKAPLAWLPWAALALIALLVGLALWAWLANRDDSGSSSSRSGASVSDGALIGGAGSTTQSLAAADGAGSDGQAAAVDVAGTVLFAESSAVIDADGRRVISQAAANIKRAGATTVVVDGYTDRIAGQPVNKPLSVQRAANVADLLTQLLGNGVEVTSRGLAEADPVASNGTEAGRAQNRRAVIHAR